VDKTKKVREKLENVSLFRFSISKHTPNIEDRTTSTQSTCTPSSQG